MSSIIKYVHKQINQYDYLSKKFVIVHSDTLIKLNYCCGRVFCSILRLCVLAFAYFFTSKVHCGSAVRFGQALPGFLITAHHLYASLP